MNKDHKELVHEHILEPISSMKPGDETDCHGLIAPEVWNFVQATERRHAFGRPVARLVAERKVPLVFSHLDSQRHNVYVKT